MAEDVEGEYRAPYLEFSGPEFAQNYTQILKRLVPEDYDIGSEDRIGDLAIRYISLPNNLIEREERIEEIAMAGTDRTDPGYESEFDILYQEAAEQAGVQPLDVMDLIHDITFHQWMKDGRLTTFGGNTILVFDKKSSFGVREIDIAEWTFKDLEQKRRALLAIIGLS